MTREYNIDQVKETIKRIDPKKEYNITGMVENKVFWWIKNFKSYVAVIMQDHKNDNILETDINGVGHSIRYIIKGQNIINFIKTYGPGLALQSMRQSRKHGKSKRNRSSKTRS